MSRAVADLPEDVGIPCVRSLPRRRWNSPIRPAGYTPASMPIEKLQAQLAALRRVRFGASSEKVERAIEQLELALEDIEAAAVDGARAAGQS